MSFQWRIINPRISLASSRLVNSQVSDISPPKTSRLYSLGITVSGPAMRAARNPSSASTFIALPPLQLLRKSPRRSSSASVRGSFWVKVLIGIAEILGDGLRYHHRDSLRSPPYTVTTRTD